jgi:hypothetical protein
MKKYLAQTALGLVALLTVATSFAASKSAEKITTIDKGSIVREGNKTTAYNKNGKWVYTIERITSDNLPADVMHVVNREFGYYYISGMEKVEQPGAEPAYIVHMQNNTSIKTVQVSGDEAKLTEDFVKG